MEFIDGMGYSRRRGGLGALKKKKLYNCSVGRKHGTRGGGHIMGGSYENGLQLSKDSKTVWNLRREGAS